MHPGIFDVIYIFHFSFLEFTSMSALLNGWLEVVLEHLQPLRLSSSAGRLFVFWGAHSKFRLCSSLPSLFLLGLL